MNLRSIVLGLATVLSAAAAFAAGGQTYHVAYGGRLTGADGAPVSGSADLEVRFYDAADGGTQLGATLPFAATALGNDGIFSVDLNLTSDVANVLFSDATKPAFIEITDTTHRAGTPYPRQRFNIVPYAVSALNAVNAVNAEKVPVDGTTITFNNAGQLTGNGAASSINGKPVASGAPASGQVLKFDGSQWVAAADNNAGGTVTTVTGAGPISVSASATAPQVSISQAGNVTAGFLTAADWNTFNAKTEKTYVDAQDAAQTAALATTNANLAAETAARTAADTAQTAALTTETTNRTAADTAINAAILKKDGSVPLTAAWNVGHQDITNTGNVAQAGGAVLGLGVTNADPPGLGAGDVGKIWYNGGIRLWNGTSAQSLGISGAGVQSLNGLNGNAQTLSNGSTGTAPTWSSVGTTHTLNIPLAATGGTTAGLVANSEWAAFNGKQPLIGAGTTSQYYRGDKSWVALDTLATAENNAGGLYFTNARAQAAITATGVLGYAAGTVSIQQTNGVTSGYLAAGDWTLFNGKEPSVTTGTTSQYYRGDKTWQSLATDARAVVSATAPLAYSSATGSFSMPQGAFAASGYLASSDWALFNAKQNAVATGNLTEATSSVLTITGGGGAVIGGGASIQVAKATGSQPGYLSSADWAVFNAKDPARAVGNLTESTSSVLTINGGTGSVIGGGASIQVAKATGSQAGYLASADWAVFNGKQPALGFTPANKAGDTLTGLLTLPANGLNVGTTQLVVSGSKVGIGVAGPGNILDVVGANGTGNALADGVRFRDSVAGVDIGGNDAGNYGWVQARSSSTGSTVVALNPNGGNVGIGTTNPVSPLTVAGTVQSTTGGFKFPDGTVQATASSAIAPTSFHVHKTSTQSMPSSGTSYKADWQATDWDTTGGFDLVADKFTPTQAGKYHIHLQGDVGNTVSGNYTQASIYKNGSAIAANFAYVAASNWPLGSVDAIVDMNGTTDYLEFYFQSSAAGVSLDSNPAYVYAEGNLLTASTAASSGSGTVSYLPVWNTTTALGNSPLSVTAGNVGIGMTSPSTALQVNGTVSATTFAGSASGLTCTGRMLGVYSSGAAVSNYSVVLNGAAGSAPSFSGSTLTLASNTCYVTVEVWGAGGGGGSISGYFSGAGGGGSGGYGSLFLNNPSGPYYYTIGAGGVGGGGGGGTTCFGTNATACTGPLLSAVGGGGGVSGGNTPSNGGAGGTASGGNFLLTGQSGSPGMGYQASSTYGGGGNGGSAPRGGAGGFGSAVAGGTGGAGGSFGGGGGGGGSSTAAGGAGGAGGILVTAYQ